jgi:membrane fusion protein (multidrug efflux system)
MFASASLPITHSQSSIFVPKSAIVTTAERTYSSYTDKGHTGLVDM